MTIITISAITMSVATVAQASAPHCRARSMALPLFRPTRRLRGKAPPGQGPQSSLLAPLELGDEAPTDGKRQAYLVTLPRPTPGAVSNGVALVAPGSKTKEDILACVLDAFANPDYANPWQAHGPVPLSKAGVWREFHFPGPNGQRDVHDHVPALGLTDFRYLPVKRSLLKRHGLASHWSCSHVGYWSCVRYVAMSSPKKPYASLDHSPVLWPKDGPNKHPPVEDSVNKPVSAAALTAKRQKLVHAACEQGKAEPRVNDLDVWALVVRSGVRNDVDDQTAHLQLAAYAKEHCGEAMVQYLFRRRHKLRSMIDDIWQWENIHEAVKVARRSRLDALAAAEQSPCTCGGAWPALVTNAFMRNQIPVPELCHDVLDALTRGRSETTPVIVLAGLAGGEGKSAFLKPLHTVYDGPSFVFATPEKGNFPLMDLPAAKVAFLDEYRWDSRIVSWAAMNLWFDGSHVPIGQPQNVPGATGNIDYKGKAPVFITCKLSDLEWLEWYAQIDPNTGNPWDTDASMVWRRLKVYKFFRKTPIPRGDTICFCGHCFARFLKAQAALWAGG